MAPRKEPFKIMEQIGGGAFGKVYRARDIKNNNRIVAVKKIDMKRHHLDPKQFREPSILSEINNIGHQNIVRLLEPIYIDDKSQLSIPMEFIKCDLAQHKGQIMNESIYDKYETRKVILKGILTGLKQMHDRGLIHRDIKPSNILMDETTSPPIPKIADFGLSRGSLMSGDLLTPQIDTAGYTAPEILLGAPYDTKVDIWGVGCIFFELLTKTASFVDKQDQVEQLKEIFSVLGSPSSQDWPEARSLKFGAYMPEPCAPDDPLEKKLPNITRVEMNLLKKLLELNPFFRITVDDALDHEYFSDQTSASSSSSNAQS